MNSNELWGYVANIVLNHLICEKFMPNISNALKEQILIWAFTNWDKVTERNLSLVEKMTKDIVQQSFNEHEYFKFYPTKNGKRKELVTQIDNLQYL